MVRFIVDRLHVSTSNRGVIREVRAALKPEARRDPGKRDMRHALYRAALKVHAENRDLYVRVVRGRL